MKKLNFSKRRDIAFEKMNAIENNKTLDFDTKKQIVLEWQKLLEGFDKALSYYLNIKKDINRLIKKENLNGINF